MKHKMKAKGMMKGGMMKKKGMAKGGMKKAMLQVVLLNQTS